VGKNNELKIPAADVQLYAAGGQPKGFLDYQRRHAPISDFTVGTMMLSRRRLLPVRPGMPVTPWGSYCCACQEGCFQFERHPSL